MAGGARVGREWGANGAAAGNPRPPALPPQKN